MNVRLADVLLAIGAIILVGLILIPVGAQLLRGCPPLPSGAIDRDYNDQLLCP